MVYFFDCGLNVSNVFLTSINVTQLWHNFVEFSLSKLLLYPYKENDFKRFFLL